MGRTKIDYGIDLGTTNSAISRMENGKRGLVATIATTNSSLSHLTFTVTFIIITGLHVSRMYSHETCQLGSQIRIPIH